LVTTALIGEEAEPTGDQRIKAAILHDHSGDAPLGLGRHPGALASSSMAIEACMLKASAVVGQPLAQRLYLADDVRGYLTDPPSQVLGRDFGIL
jgi:hypothetical protein